MVQKYYWPILLYNVETYVKGCDICLASKTVCHKPYDDLQLISVPMHWWKAFLMDFVAGLPLSINWKKNSYDSILVIVNRPMKMIHYKPVKITLNILGLAKVIIDMIVCHHGLPDLIITDKSSLLTLKFWSSLYYFLGIKQKLFIAFYPETNGQTER